MTKPGYARDITNSSRVISDTKTITRKSPFKPKSLVATRDIRAVSRMAEYSNIYICNIASKPTNESLVAKRDVIVVSRMADNCSVYTIPTQTLAASHTTEGKIMHSKIEETVPVHFRNCSLPNEKNISYGQTDYDFITNNNQIKGGSNVNQRNDLESGTHLKSVQWGKSTNVDITGTCSYRSTSKLYKMGEKYLQKLQNVRDKVCSCSKKSHEKRPNANQSIKRPTNVISNTFLVIFFLVIMIGWGYILYFLGFDAFHEVSLLTFFYLILALAFVAVLVVLILASISLAIDYLKSLRDYLLSEVKFKIWYCSETRLEPATEEQLSCYLWIV